MKRPDSSGRILVVDDNDATRYTVARTLRAEGHQVLEAVNGTQALEQAHQSQPDLMVLDVRLPDIVGFEVAERLKSDPQTRSIAILQVSASYTSADAQAMGLQRGADGYLLHPADPKVLSATVAALLRVRRAEQREVEARERAEASERRHRFLADMVPQLVWSTDAHGRVDYVNRRWREFFGDEDAQGQGFEHSRWHQSLHPADREHFLKAWTHSLRTGEPLEIEIRRWSPPKQAFCWLLARALPMRGPRGEIVRWFGTSTDIDAQKQALAERERLLAEAHELAQQREALVEQLREESRRKSDFLAMLSHELRNPLAPIRNSVYILERAAPEGEQARRAREVIDRQAQQMTRLIDDLLDLTRIARGKIRLQRESVELAGLVRRSAEDHRALMAHAGLVFDLKVADEPLRVDGDPARLAQVVGNLLHNAAKFTPAGGRVALSVVREGGVAAVHVRDTGAGIPQEMLQKLFEPFVQADQTIDRSRGGLGLGLALAKGIVVMHGGRIDASSQGAGQGSEFSVRLPLAQPAEASPEREAVQARPRFRRRSVLIIEDNRDAAESLKEALELLDHSVEIAPDGPVGLSKARASRPDVVLCDIGLPLMDGYEVARQMRADPELSSAFLVALSGYAQQEDVERSREAGFDLHMAKPPRLEAIEQVLSGAPARVPPQALQPAIY